MAIALLIASLGILLMLIILTYYLRTARINREEQAGETETEDKPLLNIFTSQNLVFTAIILLVLLVLFSIYLLVIGT